MTAVISLSYGVGGRWGSTPVDLKVALERAGDNVARPMRYMAGPITGMLEKALRGRFASEGSGGPVSGAWAPLSVSYAKRKAIAWPGRKKLAASGALRDALTQSTGRGALRESGDSSLGFGTKGIEYASYHQTGTRRMPARPPFDFGGPAFDRDFRSACQVGLIAAIRAAKLDADGDGG